MDSKIERVKKIIWGLLILVGISCEDTSSNGKKEETERSSGVDSLVVLKDVNGDTLRTIEYLRGRKHGKEIDYNFGKPAGKIIVNWLDGVAEGPFLQYYRNGDIRMSGQFKDNKKEGFFSFFYPDGKLKNKEYFVNGDLAYYEHYDKDGKLYERVMLPIIDAPKDTIHLGESYIGKYRFPFPVNSKLLLTVGEKNNSGKGLKEGFAFVQPNEEGEFEYEFTPKSAGLNSLTGIFVQKDTTIDSISVHGQMFTDGFVVLNGEKDLN